ncbi:ferrous iron transport protein A [Paenibacillus sp. N1-5-1-14]|uniref:FeoA family protein n=1 Tax=Paenibacillus radicibacter TaxID=2972488 RepID=UPI0021591148|nr:FeoA family protein [Paenibacillus radicibacter]MCR8642475.1 ferrous iron transport protein A [Paenibacillus radicibacter]
MKLADIPVGKSVRITDVTTLNELVRRRLMDLGIMEGAVISLRKTLPFGGPFTIESSGQWIAIRRSEACQIAVEGVC